MLFIVERGKNRIGNCFESHFPERYTEKAVEIIQSTSLSVEVGRSEVKSCISRKLEN